MSPRPTRPTPGQVRVPDRRHSRRRHRSPAADHGLGPAPVPEHATRHPRSPLGSRSPDSAGTRTRETHIWFSGHARHRVFLAVFPGQVGDAAYPMPDHPRWGAENRLRRSVSLRRPMSRSDGPVPDDIGCVGGASRRCRPDPGCTSAPRRFVSTLPWGRDGHRDRAAGGLVRASCSLYRRWRLPSEIRLSGAPGPRWHPGSALPPPSAGDERAYAVPAPSARDRVEPRTSSRPCRDRTSPAGTLDKMLRV